MKIKASDIAKALNLSPATVSLALNNKPGVKEETRKKIQECKQLMEEGKFPDPAEPKENYGVIKFIHVVGGIFSRSHLMDNFEETNQLEGAFIDRARSLGYSCELINFDVDIDSKDTIENQCGQEEVRGVAIGGFSLTPKQLSLFSGIKKPVVLCYTDGGNQYSSVNFNNRQAIDLAYRYLRKISDAPIMYFSRGINAFYYLTRQEEFLALSKTEPGNTIVPVGQTVDEGYEKILSILKKEGTPHLLLSEDYHVTISLLKACHDLRLRIGKDLHVAAIDTLPRYTYIDGAADISIIKMPYRETGDMLMFLLDAMITGKINDATRIKTYINAIQP